MHCYAFEMYIKDGPLRSSDYIFAKCMQGGEGGGKGGVGEEEEEEGGNFKL